MGSTYRYPIKGDSGFSGFSGYSGMPGEAAASGYSGFSGAQGMPGIPGTQGTSGFSGFSGEQGEQGTSGISGYSGIGLDQGIEYFLLLNTANDPLTGTLHTVRTIVFGTDKSAYYNQQIPIPSISTMGLSGAPTPLMDLIISANSIRGDFGAYALNKVRGQKSFEFQSSSFDSSNYAKGNYSFIGGGYENDATGDYSHAEGYYNDATGDYSHAEGYYNVSTGPYSHVEGISGITSKDSNASHIEGFSNSIDAPYAHAEGQNNKIISGSDSAHVEGKNTKVNGNATAGHAEGINTIVDENAVAAHAEGNTTVARGINSHAEGNNTLAQGNNSHVEGISGTTYANNSHVEGNSNTVTLNATNAHAEGNSTTVNGSNAHAEGSNTTADGESSHSEGYTTIAYGNYSHAGGQLTQTGINHGNGGLTSFAHGLNLQAANNYSTIFGACVIPLVTKHDYSFVTGYASNEGTNPTVTFTSFIDTTTNTLKDLTRTGINFKDKYEDGDPKSILHITNNDIENLPSSDGDYHTMLFIENKYPFSSNNIKYTAYIKSGQLKVDAPVLGGTVPNLTTPPFIVNSNKVVLNLSSEYWYNNRAESWADAELGGRIAGSVPKRGTIIFYNDSLNKWTYLEPKSLTDNKTYILSCNNGLLDWIKTTTCS